MADAAAATPESEASKDARSEPNWMLVSLLLMVAILATAVGVIYTAHSSRDLFRELEQARHENNEIQLEWRQLLLERSALSSHARVESLARTELQMTPPPEQLQVMVVE